MDLSKLSDENLISLHKGQPLDYSKFSDDELKALYQPQPKEISQAESLGRGLVQGGTFNFGDEIGGGLYALKDAAGKMSLSDLVSDYVKNRDDIRNNNDAAKKANPWTYGAGELGGGVATSLIPGVGFTKGASLANILTKGAAIGGANALGASRADLTQGDVGGAALDTTIGAGLGAGASYVGSKVAPLLAQTGKGTTAAGEMLAENASGAKNLPAGAGRQLLDTQNVRMLDTADNIAQRVGQGGMESATDAALLPQTQNSFAPIQEAITGAAENRANNPEPSGFGLKDVLAGGAGFFKGGPLGTVASVVGRRVVEPRLASTGAVALDAIGSGLQKTLDPAMNALQPQVQQAGILAAQSLHSPAENPNVGKIDVNSLVQKLQADPKSARFLKPIQQAASRGDDALASTYFILQQTEPDFQRVVRGEH